MSPADSRNAARSMAERLSLGIASRRYAQLHPETRVERPTLPEHGGNLREAAARFGTPADGWLDLSTGINPTPYPAPEPTHAAWHALPDPHKLEAAAASYYEASTALAVPGSQIGLSLLPTLRSPSRIAIPTPEYAEHATAWRNGGHTVDRLPPETIAAGPPDPLPWQALVLSHPNNPTGRRYPLEALRAWRSALAARGGWLVVDEAFADTEPRLSLASEAGAAGLITLRSLGKFFGLPGARIGFVLAPHSLQARLGALLGPWPVPGPSQEAARAALTDTHWQASQMAALQKAAGQLDNLLTQARLPPAGGTLLFRWVPCREPRERQAELAQSGIWVRAFDDPPGLRFGLPAQEREWQRLETALQGRPPGRDRAPGALEPNA